MNKKIGLLFGMILICMLSHAQASDSAIEHCISQGQSAARLLDLPFEVSRDDKIGQCMSKFVSVNNPKLHVLALEKEEDCGFICRSKWSLLASTYDADGYYGLLEERIDKEDLQKVEKLTGVNIKEMVFKEYSIIESYNAEREAHLNTFNRIKRRVEARNYPEKEYGLPLLKAVIFEFTKLSIKSQLIELKIDQIKEVQETARGLEKDVKDCLDVVTTEEGLALCADKVEENAVYIIGRYTLDIYIDEYFEERVEPAEFKVFKQKASENYDSCSISYFFNDDETAEKQSDKILPCVYNALLESFIEIAEALVIQNSDMDQFEAKIVVVDLVDQCGEKPIVTLENNARLRSLQSMSIEDFTEYLLGCQKSLTLGVIAKVGSASISEHPSVIEILGAEKAKTFAAEVLKEEIPVCFKRLGTEDEPEKCENYLFARTSSRLFPVVIEQEFKKVQTEFPFLSDDLIALSVKDSEVQLKACEDEMLTKFKTFSNLSAEEAEVQTAQCLRTGILSSLERVVDKYVQVEIQNNPVLKKNGIEFGPDRRAKLKTDFFSCSALNIKTSEGLKSVVETSSTFLDKCVLSLTQEVVLDTFETIVFEKLFEVGLERAQISVVYTDYQGDPNNLLDAIKGAKNIIEVEDILVGAEQKIISSVSQNVIKFLIINKTPVKFEQEVINDLSKMGSDKLKACLQGEELRVCAADVELVIMTEALGIFLPEAIYNVFKEQLADSLSAESFEALGLQDKIAAALNTTEDGRILKMFIITEIAKNTSVEEIQEMKEVNDFVVKHIYKPISNQLIRSIIVKKSPVPFSKDELNSLVEYGESTINKCLETKSVADCSVEAEKVLTAKAIESFLPQAAYDEVKGALKDVLTSKEIKSYDLFSKLKEGISSSKEGRILIEHIANEIAKGSSVDEIKSDKKIIAYIIDVAIEPIAADVISKLIVKKSPIKFSKSNMRTLVSTGKSSLIKCLKSGKTDVCADQTEEVILKKAVVLYLPQAVNVEFRDALSDWFTKKEIDSYGLVAKFTQSLTTGKVGSGVLKYIAGELGKGVSAERIQKRSRVTSYVYLVLSTYKAPGRSGRMIVDDIAHRIIQKEINKFIRELNQGKHGGFFTIGFNIHFAGAKAKTSFDWSNSKNTKAGKQASSKFKSIFKNVIESGVSIKDSDIEVMKELVKDAILQYRNIAIKK